MYLRLIRVVVWIVLILSFLFLLSVGIAVDPQTLNQWGIALVFGVCFLFLLSSVFLLLMSLCIRFLGEARAALYQPAAFRQASLLGGFLVSLLIGQYLKILTWWGACLGFVFILLVELTYRRIANFRR